MTPAQIRAAFPARDEYAHKGSTGAGLLVAGSYKMPGAAIIAAKGALNSGIGLLSLAFPDCIYGAVTAHLTESLLLPCFSTSEGCFTDDGFEGIFERARGVRAVAAGPGLGLSEATKNLVYRLITETEKPLVLDADALNAVALDTEILLSRKKDPDGKPYPTLITPHPGEMSRLIGYSIAIVQDERKQNAEVFARKYGVYILLKGHDTVVASPYGETYINRTGCPAMARGGSGDLLTGMLLSFLSQRIEPYTALCAAAYYHGLAGERAAAKYGEYCATVERIADEIRIR